MRVIERGGWEAYHRDVRKAEAAFSYPEWEEAYRKAYPRSEGMTLLLYTTARDDGVKVQLIFGSAF